MHQDVLLTRYVEGKEDQVEKVLYQLADIDISEIPKDFILLPTHPYQINVLRQHPQYMQYSEQGLIKTLAFPVIQCTRRLRLELYFQKH